MPSSATRARLDHRLPHQRPRLEDARGPAGDPERAARARLPLRLAVGADAGGGPKVRAAGAVAGTAVEAQRSGLSRRRARCPSEWPRSRRASRAPAPRWPGLRGPGSRRWSPGAGSGTAPTRSDVTWPARPEPAASGSLEQRPRGPRWHRRGRRRGPAGRVHRAFGRPARMERAGPRPRPGRARRGEDLRDAQVAVCLLRREQCRSAAFLSKVGIFTRGSPA